MSLRCLLLEAKSALRHELTICTGVVKTSGCSTVGVVRIDGTDSKGPRTVPTSWSASHAVLSEVPERSSATPLLSSQTARAWPKSQLDDQPVLASLGEATLDHRPELKSTPPMPTSDDGRSSTIARKSAGQLGASQGTLPEMAS